MNEYTTHRTEGRIVLIINGHEMANVPISKEFALFVANILKKNAKNIEKYVHSKRVNE